MRDEGKFELTDVTWLHEKSRAITSDRSPPKSIRVGVQSASARCNDCGHGWRTSLGSGPGQFRAVLGGIDLECPACDVEGFVATRTLD